MKYNYSVIIPFRDRTDLLRKACASIPVRDDIQVIVVDNAQNPLGADAVNDFSNPNIEYYTSSPTKGAGCARNEGLNHAKGKYLLFLDADDYFTSDAFSAFDKELKSGCDIIFYNATSIKLKDGSISTRHKRIDSIIKEAIKTGKTDILRYQYDNPISKMVSYQLVRENSIKFQEVRVSNDVQFSLYIGYYAQTIKVVDQVVYVITEGEKNTSLTKTKNAENQFIRFQVAVDHDAFLHSIGRDDMRYRLISFILHAFIDFGWKEGEKWLSYALQKKANLFKS